VICESAYAVVLPIEKDDITGIWCIVNLDGVICLPFSAIWLILSIGAVFLADAINYYVFAELPIPHYYIFGYKFLSFKERK